MPIVLVRYVGMRAVLAIGALVQAAASIAAGGLTPPPTLYINNTNKPPYTTLARNGCIDRIINEAFARIGRDVRLVIQPPERGLLNANSGQLDGDLTRIDAIARLYPNLRRVEETLFTWHFAAFSKNSDLIESWNRIHAKPVGHIKGWKIYEAKLEGAKAVTATVNEQHLFRLLKLNRVDTVLYERWQGKALLDALGFAEKVFVRNLEKRPMYIYLHRRHVDLVELLAQSLRELKAEGFYAQAMQPCRRATEL